jgi:hypothetical protein
MKIFKALSRMVKIFTQVGIFKAMKMIMSMVDTMLMMIFLQMIMLVMMFSIIQLQQIKVINIL